MQTEALPGHLLTEWLEEDGWNRARADRRIHGTVVFRPAKPRDGDWEASTAGRRLSRDETDRLFAPDPAAVVRMAAYLEEAGLVVSPPAADGLYLDFAGPLASVTTAFRCTFAEKLLDGRVVYLNREEPQVPPWAVPHVLAILGLENRAAAHPFHRYPGPRALPANGGQGFFPADLATAYQFPGQLDGTGQTIGVLEFSNGYNPQDLEAFWSAHGVAAPEVAFVSVDGTPNDGGVSSVDMECTLDLEWAGAMAPGARLVVYEASGLGSDTAFAESFLKALEAVVSDETYAPSVVSVSYGDAETHFTRQALAAWDQAVERALARGITVVVASGDEGAYGIRGAGRPVPHCDAPASLPHVLAVGGTTLTLTATGERLSEVAWSDTNNNGASGGGISVVFGPPSWQATAQVPLNPAGNPGRGVPDVALNANPDTGYNVVFQGESMVVGGTSAAAPTWAALLARVNQGRALQGLGPVGFSNPVVYASTSRPAFFDIVSGNNSIDGVAGYACGPGWSAVTGWGSVDGTALATLFGVRA